MTAISRGLVAASTALPVGVLAAQYVPSVVVLGQWTPLRALPRGWCRWRGPRVPKVAITFDDGPDDRSTPSVLDELDALGFRATFFCIGSLAERHRDLVTEIARRGHQVALHGFRHEHHLLRGPRWIARDLSDGVAVMESCGLSPRWYRPTYGQATVTTLVWARRLGLLPVLWSTWGMEWRTDDPSEVAERVCSRLDPGAIILLHDNDDFGPPGMWKVGLRALRLVADELSRRELAPVTLDELMATPA